MEIKNTMAPFSAQLSYQYAVARTVRLKNAFTEENNIMK